MFFCFSGCCHAHRRQARALDSEPKLHRCASHRCFCCLLGFSSLHTMRSSCSLSLPSSHIADLCSLNQLLVSFKMRFWTSGYTLLGATLLHIALAAESSFSWSPLQTQAEDIEYNPQPKQPRPVSALEVLQVISPVIEKVHGYRYGDEEDNLGRFHRCVVALLQYLRCLYLHQHQH